MSLEARNANDAHNSLWHIVDVGDDKATVVGLIVITTDDPAVALSEWQAAIVAMEAPG